MLKLEQDLRSLIADWQNYANQDNESAKRNLEMFTDDSAVAQPHASWLAGKSSAYQECARTLQILLDEGGGR